MYALPVESPIRKMPYSACTAVRNFRGEEGEKEEEWFTQGPVEETEDQEEKEEKEGEEPETEVEEETEEPQEETKEETEPEQDAEQEVWDACAQKEDGDEE